MPCSYAHACTPFCPCHAPEANTAVKNGLGGRLLIGEGLVTVSEVHIIRYLPAPGSFLEAALPDSGDEPRRSMICGIPASTRRGSHSAASFCITRRQVMKCITRVICALCVICIMCESLRSR